MHEQASKQTHCVSIQSSYSGDEAMYAYTAVNPPAVWQVSASWHDQHSTLALPPPLQQLLSADGANLERRRQQPLQALDGTSQRAQSCTVTPVDGYMRALSVGKRRKTSCGHDERLMTVERVTVQKIKLLH